MAKKQPHTGFRNGDLFCFHCGTSYKVQAPQPVDMMIAIMTQFEKSHKNCPKTWVEPQPEPTDKTWRENASWWSEHGEQGLSSKTMFRHLGGGHIDGYDTIPYDPDDFRRCHLLLEAVPQWRQELHKLKTISPTWSNLVDNWDKLTEMLIELMKNKKDNGMYDFMQTLRC